MSEHRLVLLNGVSWCRLFPTPPGVECRPSITHCPRCGCELKVRKTRTRTVSTLHVGRFQATEVVLACSTCQRTYRSEELGQLVPPGANFGYDVMVYAGQALWLRCRNEEEVVAELAQKNVQISPREVSLLGMKFIVYLTLIQWALSAKAEGDGYGFPFDHPHLAFAQRLQRLNAHIERIKDIHLRGQWRDNRPYFKLHIALQAIMKDKTLWKTVTALEAKIGVFENLRKAMRIAMPAGPHGLNDDGGSGAIRAIEKRVTAFRTWLTRRKDYSRDRAAQKMIDKYWEKLFADPIAVQTPSGPILIQPQRTNNLLEQFFRSLKRAHRRRTGNAASGRMLRTILAETPLVRNLQNPHYMTLLLNGKSSLEEIFAQIEIDTLRQAFREAQVDPERIPSKLKLIIAMPDFPERFVMLVEKAVA